MPAGDAFSAGQVDAIERAIDQARAESDLSFSVFVGAPEGDLREQGRRLLAALGEDADRSVVVAVDPAQRRLEILTGVHGRALPRRPRDSTGGDVDDVVVRRRRPCGRHRGRAAHAERARAASAHPALRPPGVARFRTPGGPLDPLKSRNRPQTPVGRP